MKLSDVYSPLHCEDCYKILGYCENIQGTGSTLCPDCYEKMWILDKDNIKQ